MPRKVTIELIDHHKQRYVTVGDWFYSPSGTILHIKVSRMADVRSEMAVALHELAEALACEYRGIDQGTVDQFDFNWSGYDEPGDSPDAPYHREHMMATEIEKAFCACVDLDWEEHNRNVEDL